MPASVIVGSVGGSVPSHIATEWLYRQGLFRLQMNGQWALFAWGGVELEPGQDLVDGGADGVGVDVVSRDSRRVGKVCRKRGHGFAFR